MIDACEHTTFNHQHLLSELSEKFSRYIVYVDESGDQNVTSIDPLYPVFVLAFCIFEKNTYADAISPAIRKLKFKHFGHDMTILHELEIRKSMNHFKFLLRPDYRQFFMNELNVLIKSAPFTLVAVAVKKSHCQDKKNPYHLAMQFGLEKVYDFLLEKHENTKTTHVIFEARGKKEDAELCREFKQICLIDDERKKTLPFELLLADKRSNCSGLQIADLVARPIGRYILDNTQENRAYQVLQEKFYSKNGKIEGYGLNCFL